jgi:hypothetical protein
LDTNNNFTGNNTFNTNLPTSDVNPDLGNINDNTMLNRFSADKLYSTDTNDFITAFSRDGTTGIITLTQADTGTPITSKNYTSITDNEITAIGTNTGAISTLTSNLDPCFKSATINGQDLTLTPVAGTATVIAIPSGGGANAVLKDGGTIADPQILSGVNRINVESTPNNTGDAINQFYGDANYGYKLDFGYAQLVSTQSDQAVSNGNPSASDPDQFNGLVDALSVEITPNRANGVVKLQFQINGEWGANTHEKGGYIAVATKNADGTFTYNRALRGNPSGVRSLVISGFTIGWHTDNTSTPERCDATFIDAGVNQGTTYKYTPVLVNTTGGTTTFRMNRTYNDSNNTAFERLCSSMTAQIMGYE